MGSEQLPRPWPGNGWPSTHPMDHASCRPVCGQLERDIFPWIGAEPIATLKAPELLAVVRRIEERGALRMAQAPFRSVGGCSAMRSRPTGRAGRVVGLAWCPAAGQDQHLAAITDPKEVGPLLRVLDGYPGTLPVRCALRLAPLVLCGRELRRAEWADIDVEAAEWRYTVTKTSTPHVVHLARQAVEILRELHPLTGTASTCSRMHAIRNRIGRWPKRLCGRHSGLWTSPRTG